MVTTVADYSTPPVASVLALCLDCNVQCAAQAVSSTSGSFHRRVEALLEGSIPCQRDY